MAASRRPGTFRNRKRPATDSDRGSFRPLDLNYLTGPKSIARWQPWLKSQITLITVMITMIAPGGPVIPILDFVPLRSHSPSIKTCSITECFMIFPRTRREFRCSISSSAFAMELAHTRGDLPHVLGSMPRACAVGGPWEESGFES